MTIPNYENMMLPVLKILQDGTPHTNEEIIETLADQYSLSPEDRKKIYGGNNTKIIFNDRIAWARTYLKKAGLMIYPERGLNQLTEEGLSVLKQNPQIINNKFLSQFKTFRTFRNLDKEASETIEDKTICDTTQTPDERIIEAKETLYKHLENDLIEQILSNSPLFFERLVAKLLFKMGYGGSESDILQSCGKSGDGGIDGIINQDILGLDQVHIQAKRYKEDNIVQVGALRDFCGALYGKKNPKGVFITTSNFTKGAFSYAQENDLVLINGKKLTKFMVEYNIGVQTKEVIEIKKIDTDFFEED